MIKPLPRRLLIHSCTIVRLGKPDKWGNRAEKDRTDLSVIRIETTEERTQDKQNTSKAKSAVLYYDCVLSKPVGYTFKLGDRVTFESENYVIHRIRRLDTDKPHHYEVELIKQ